MTEYHEDIQNHLLNCGLSYKEIIPLLVSIVKNRYTADYIQKHLLNEVRKSNTTDGIIFTTSCKISDNHIFIYYAPITKIQLYKILELRTFI